MKWKTVMCNGTTVVLLLLSVGVYLGCRGTADPAPATDHSSENPALGNSKNPKQKEFGSEDKHSAKHQDSADAVTRPTDGFGLEIRRLTSHVDPKWERDTGEMTKEVVEKVKASLDLDPALVED